MAVRMSVPVLLLAMLSLGGCFRLTGLCISDEMCGPGSACRVDGTCSPGSGDLGGVGDLAMACSPGGAGLNLPQVTVPGGMYSISGSPSFAVDPFLLDVSEVTVAAYRDCVSACGCSAPSAGLSCNWSAQPAREDHPINCVTWPQARDFCAWAKRRLPTEAEWGYAAAGTGMSLYPWGSDAPVRAGAGTPQLCWDRTSAQGTCAAGSFGRTLRGARDGSGVADLAGNVWEWTDSQYQASYAHPAQACSSNAASCSRRGNSWGTLLAEGFEAAYRYSGAPGSKDAFTGFRCAKNGP